MRTTLNLARLAAATVTAAALLAPPVLSASSAAAHTSVQPSTTTRKFVLPKPTGRFAVGRDVLHLVDDARPDPWVPTSRRELLVSMHYPALTRFGRPTQYLQTTEARLFTESRGLTGVVDPVRLSRTRTAARVAAPPHWGRHPLVVLSPGFGVHRHTLTHLAEDLASRGYIVATVDHAYESVGTVFPPKRVLTCTACASTAGQGRVDSGRAQDITFLLNRLTGPRPAWRHADRIDRTRIGMAGHSIGGSSAAATMAADPRVLAGVNMDGTFFTAVPADGLDGRPFLMLGSPAHAPGGVDRSWDRDWQRLDGWKRWLTVTGTAHIDFSDLSVLADQAGLPDADSPLSGERTAQIMRAYVRAFFDLHLRAIPQPLLDGPTSNNPEVVFHHVVASGGNDG